MEVKAENYEVINGIRSLNALVTVNSFIDSVYVYEKTL